MSANTVYSKEQCIVGGAGENGRAILLFVSRRSGACAASALGAWSVVAGGWSVGGGCAIYGVGYLWEWRLYFFWILFELC